MRALVTGCAGFIGSHLTESLLEDGVEVVGVDCFNDNYARRQKLKNLERATEWRNFEFVPIDLARGDLHDLVGEVDTVFHLAAEPGVRASWGDRFELYVRNNVLATQQLLEAASQWPENRFVFASSSSVYGEAERFPTPETVTPKPFSPYGVTKLSAEHLCQAYHRNLGVDVVMLRYFSVYGPRQRPDMGFHRFCRAAIRSEKITVFGDGRQTRDFTFVSDVVRATRSAAQLPDLGGLVLNVGGGAQVSVNEALAFISELADGPLDVEYVEPVHGDVRDTCADPALARRHLGLVPETAWRDGLQAQWAWSLEVEQPGAGDATAAPD
jgi:nucleoside-diphosphate-sugar epimerase